MRLLWAFTLTLLLLGCPASRRPVASCTQTGEQCTLPDGPLGVCTPTSTTGVCEHEPCLECMPQH